MSRCSRVLELWGASPGLCQARLSNWIAETHKCFLLSAGDPPEHLFVFVPAVFGLRDGLIRIPIPHPQRLSSLFLTGGWEAALGVCGGGPTCGPLEEKAALPQPLTLGFWPPLPPNCQRIQFPAFVRGQDSTTSLAPHSRLEAKVTPPTGEL